jgi:hypothetical protein
MKGRLTHAQGKFLRALCYHRGTVEELAKECGTPMHTVERWLGEKNFRRGLRQRTKGMERLRELDVKRGAMEAARRMSRAAYGVGDFTKKNLYERRACVDLIQLARSWEREAKGAADAAAVARASEGPADEREFVRSINGEAGVRAYDEMVREREGRAYSNDETRNPKSESMTNDE